MAESLSLRGTLEGHRDWVTSIATPLDPNSDTILSASRWAHAGEGCIGSQLQPQHMGAAMPTLQIYKRAWLNPVANS